MNNYIEYFDDDIDLDNFNNYLDKSKKRAIRRKVNVIKAKRKQIIDKNIHNSYNTHPWYNNLHQYSKNKIHCSCPLCAFNHKKFRHKNYTIQDLKQLENMDYQEREYLLN